MNSPASRYLGRRDGQAGLFVVLNLTVLLAVMGLAIDVGWGYFRKHAAQTAADAAALAAASYASANGLTCGTGGVVCGTATPCNYPNVSPPTNDLEVGCSYAGANGYYNTGSQSVSMMGNTTAPPGVSGNSPAYWVQASVTDGPFTLFGNFAGVSAFNINTVATAAVTVIPAAACIYVLDSTASQAFSATGTSVVTATCGIFVNSNSASAYYEYGSPHVTATQILVNGGTSITSASSVSPTPTTNAGAQTDPLASLAMPTVSSTCDHTNYSIGNANTATLSPGVYCGGIVIQGNSRVTFNPGLYIVNGGGMSFGNGTVVTGSGVTFFNTGQNGYTAGPVTNTGNTTVTLSAPTSGTYEGMLIVQDRNISYLGTNSFANSANTVFSGTMYFPSTKITYSGASSTSTYTALIGKTVSFTGSAAFKNDPTGTYTGLAATVRSLIR